MKRNAAYISMVKAKGFKSHYMKYKYQLEYTPAYLARGEYTHIGHNDWQATPHVWTC